MADMHDIDVIFSYDHHDREHVRPGGGSRRDAWVVWCWETGINNGSVWRDMLTDRFDHARAVCVIWTVRSVNSEFVRYEASRANARGVVVPIRLESAVSLPASARSDASSYAAQRS